MLTMLIAFVAAFCVYVATAEKLGSGWAAVCAAAAMIAVNLCVGLLVRRKVNSVTAHIQKIMEAGQARINRKMQQLQQRPVGSVKLAQEMLNKEQTAALKEALEATHAADRYFKWNMMLKRQMATMRMMLYFQLKDYAKVDELLPKCLFMDSRSVAVKMIRMYKHDDPKLEKFFRSKTRRAKGDDMVLLASLYAWMLVKKEKFDTAIEVLSTAKKTTDEPVIAENWERLVNGKVKHFSNAALGDAWYSLYLEEPKVKQQRVVQRY